MLVIRKSRVIMAYTLAKICSFTEWSSNVSEDAFTTPMQVKTRENIPILPNGKMLPLLSSILVVFAHGNGRISLLYANSNIIHCKGASTEPCNNVLILASLCFCMEVISHNQAKLVTNEVKGWRTRIPTAQHFSLVVLVFQLSLLKWWARTIKPGT